MSPIRKSNSLLDSFRLPQRKNFLFQLSGHDVCRVHEKVLSRRFERAIFCYTHLSLLNPKLFDSLFLDMMYVEKSYLADSNNLMAPRFISAH